MFQHIKNHLETKKKKKPQLSNQCSPLFMSHQHTQENHKLYHKVLETYPTLFVFVITSPRHHHLPLQHATTCKFNQFELDYKSHSKFQSVQLHIVQTITMNIEASMTTRDPYYIVHECTQRYAQS